MDKKMFYRILLIPGLILFFFGGVVIKAEAYKALSGICIGLGAGLFGLSCSNIWMQSYAKKNPQVMEESNIAYADERNTMIRNKAKAQTADIVQWCIAGLAFLSILMNSPLWVTLLIVGIFLLKTIVEFYLIGKYAKEM